MEITSNFFFLIFSYIADRYIALAANGDNIAIAIPIAREFQNIYKDHAWIPRRTLIFLMSSNSMESCLFSLSNYERSKIVAYLAIDKNPIEGSLLELFIIKFIC